LAPLAPLAERRGVVGLATRFIGALFDVCASHSCHGVAR
jgi:hypothetical protein